MEQPNLLTRIRRVNAIGIKLRIPAIPGFVKIQDRAMRLIPNANFFSLDVNQMGYHVYPQDLIVRNLLQLMLVLKTLIIILVCLSKDYVIITLNVLIF